MTHKEIFRSDEIRDLFAEACRADVCASVSFCSGGQWRLLEAGLCGCSEQSISLMDTGKEEICVYQPVGINFQFEHYKILFESRVMSVDSNAKGRLIQVEWPEKIERMQRRIYDRRPVPASLKVRVLFWHRGYIADAAQKPAELYWQGRLLNLSAGGAQFEIEDEQKQCFSQGQLLGVQFTPLSYQKPLLLESVVRYLKDRPENGHFNIGVEFLGLEVIPEGRETLGRLLEVLAEYEKMGTGLS